MNVNIEIQFPRNADTLEKKIDLCVRQVRAIEKASSHASISDGVLLVDTYSIMFNLFKNVFGEMFVEAYRRQ